MPLLPRPMPAAPADLGAAAARPLPPGLVALDPVLAPLVAAGLATPSQVIATVAAGGEGAVWRRLLAIHPALDAAAVRRVAARVLGVPVVEAGEMPTAAFVEQALGLLPPELAEGFRAARLVPCRLVASGEGREARMLVVSDDPFDPARIALTSALGTSVDLALADAADLDRVLGVAALPVPPGEALEPAPAGSDTFAPDLFESGFLASDLQAPDRLTVALAADLAASLAADAAAGQALGGPLDGEGTVGEGAAGLAGHRSGDGAASPAPHLGEQMPDGWTPAPPDESVLTPPESPSPGKETPRPVLVDTKDRVVQQLARKGLVSAALVAEAQRRQADDATREALWRVLAGTPGVPREAVFAEAARVYAFPVAAIREGHPDAEFVRSVFSALPDDRRERLMTLGVVPLECDLDAQSGSLRVVFATHDPARPEVHSLLKGLRLDRFEVHYAPEAAVRGVLESVYPRRNEYLERLNEGGGMAFDLGASFDQKARGLIDEDALEAEIGRSTLINLFEATLLEAVRQGASDIHIYPNHRRQIEIHFRVDGRLYRWHVEDKVHPEALLAVVKDNATGIDRFERERAQDGFIQRTVDEALIRFRVSVLPVANANGEIRSESIVIRILDDRKVVTDLQKLGLNQVALDRFDHAIRQPHGMVILTGPTGSGKSTTLVASLAQVVTPEVNVLTVEDPVEYIIPGVRQIKLSHKLGLEDALRAILRHDPDVVMVGEMRDRATAELAIKLANTGHLTFSTLHTNDAPSAVARLFKMGIEPFLLAYAINLIVAQRLMRLLCPTCKRPETDPDPLLRDRLGVSPDATLFEAGHDRACRMCKGTGYKGRKAINECLLVSRAIRQIIVASEGLVDEEAIRQTAVAEGMLTLQDSARLLVEAGETSLDEMMRATASDL